jgi:hypothetical protein
MNKAIATSERQARDKICPYRIILTRPTLARRDAPLHVSSVSIRQAACHQCLSRQQLQWKHYSCKGTGILKLDDIPVKGSDEEGGSKWIHAESK